MVIGGLVAGDPEGGEPSAVAVIALREPVAPEPPAQVSKVEAVKSGPSSASDV